MGARTAPTLRRALAAAFAGLVAVSLVLMRGSLLGLESKVSLAGAPHTERGRAADRSSPPNRSSADSATSTVAPVAPRSAPPALSRVVAETFYSQAMRTERPFDIYLPPSYDQAAAHTYPVLYLLHGDGGHFGDWVALGLRQKMDQAIADGAPEMIVAMPDGSGRSGDLTDWANRWDGTDPVEDQVLEVVRFVDRSYRTIPDRSTRFIGGLSSGGFGSLNLALHHPDLFSAAMSFSGFTAANDVEADAGAFGEDPSSIERNSPADLVTSEPDAGDIYYVLSAGQRDPHFLGRMATFSAELERLGFAHEFHVVPGGHDGTAWDAGLDFGLAHLAAQIRALGEPPRSSQ